MSEHLAKRPSWDCLACGKPWPCDPAREHLAAMHSPTRLAMLQWGNLEDAAGDLPGMPVAEAYDRFIAWTRPARVNKPITQVMFDPEA